MFLLKKTSINVVNSTNHDGGGVKSLTSKTIYVLGA